MTTDFPNGGPFTAYPRIISWLMDGDKRLRLLDSIHPAAKERTDLAEITNEYTLNQVFAMTSSGPAKALGLCDRGHLGSGAIADVRCYCIDPDIEAMFSSPCMVIKDGQIVLRQGKIMNNGRGHTLVCRPEWDRNRLPRIHEAMAKHLSIAPQNYGWVGRESSQVLEVIPCRSGE